MKRYISISMVCIMFMFILIPTAYALPSAGLLRGMLPWTGGGVASYTEVNKMTDGNDSTYGTLGQSTFAKYYFDVPKDIKGYYWRAAGVGFQPVYLELLDSSNKILATYGSNSGMTSYQMLDTTVKGVKYVRIYRGNYTGTSPVYELDLLEDKPEPPQAPTGLNAISKILSVDLTWNSVSEVLGYNVYKNGVKVNDSLITNTNYTVNGLLADINNTYQVVAVNDVGESQKSNSVIQYALAELIIPNLIYSDLTSNSLRLNWNNSGTSYDIYQNDVLIRENYTYTFFDITNLSPDTTYNFKIVATDKYYRVTDSNILNIKTNPSILNKPVFNFINVTHNSFNIKIDNQEFVDKYEIYLNDSLFYTGLELNHSFNSLNAETSYNIKVVASNSMYTTSTDKNVLTKEEPIPKINYASVSSGSSPTTKKLTYEPNDLVTNVKIYVNGQLIGEYPATQKEIELDFADLQDSAFADITIEPTDLNSETYERQALVKSTGSEMIDNTLNKMVENNQVEERAFKYLLLGAIPLSIIVILFFWLRNKFKGMFGKVKNYHGEAKDSKGATVRKSQNNKYTNDKFALTHDNPANLSFNKKQFDKVKKSEYHVSNNNKKGFNSNGFDIVEKNFKTIPVGFMGTGGLKNVPDFTYQRDGVLYKQKYVRGQGKVFVPKDFGNQLKHVNNQFSRVYSVFTGSNKKKK